MAKFERRFEGSIARLTPAQRARVRELVEDEGESKESAIAWVRAFEPATTADFARHEVQS